MEPIGPKGRRRAGPGKTDYLICVEVPNGTKPLPVAVLEAKKEDEDPLKGIGQAKNYSECKGFDAKYVFSTNGHRYAKVNKFTGEYTGPFPFADFPDHKRLTDCYHRHTGIKLDEPPAELLFQQSEVEKAKAEAVSLKEKLKALKVDGTAATKIEKHESAIREREKTARDAQAKIDDIDAAVFDLKAVNPNAIVKVDERTPEEVIRGIEDQGKIVAEALSKLRSLIQNGQVSSEI